MGGVDVGAGVKSCYCFSDLDTTQLGDSDIPWPFFEDGHPHRTKDVHAKRDCPDQKAHMLHIPQSPHPTHKSRYVKASMEDSNVGVEGLMENRLRDGVPQVQGYMLGHHTEIGENQLCSRR